MALVDLLTDLSNFKYTDYDNVGANNSSLGGRHGGYKGDGQPPHPEEHSKFDDKSGVNLSQIKGRHGGTEGPTPAQPPHPDDHSIYDDGVGFGVAPSDKPQSFDVRGYTITGNKRFYIGWQGDIMNHSLSDYGIGAFNSIAGVFDYTQTRDRLRKAYDNYDIIEFGADGSVHVGDQDLAGVVGGGLSYYGSLVSITPRGSIYRTGDGTYRVPQKGVNTLPPGGISNILAFEGTQITHNIPQIVLTGPFGDEEYQSTLQLTPVALDAHGSDFMTTPLASYISQFSPTYPTTVHESGFGEVGSFYFYNNKGPSSFGEFKEMTKSDDGIKTMEFGKMGIVGSLTLGKEDINFPDRIPYNIPARDNNVIGFDQPFILKDIGDKWGPWGLGAIDEGLFRGGFVTSAARTVADVLRIGKFILTPKGIMFGLKQVILQKLNPRKETRTWNPLSLGSLAPMVHINRHWGSGTYEEAIDKDGWDSDGFGSILDGYADAVISPVPSVGLIFTTGRRATLAHAVAMVPSRGGKMALPGIPELKWSDFPVGNIDSLSKNIVGENKFGLSGLFGLGKKEYLKSHGAGSISPIALGQRGVTDFGRLQSKTDGYDKSKARQSIIDVYQGDEYSTTLPYLIDLSKVQGVGVELGDISQEERGLRDSGLIQITGKGVIYRKRWTHDFPGSSPKIWSSTTDFIKDKSLENVKGPGTSVYQSDAYSGDSDSSKYFTPHGTPTKPTHVAKGSEKALGHASAPSAKQKIVFINKKSPIPKIFDGDIGVLKPVSTKFDHENADGDEVKYTLPTGITKIHDGINIYKDENIYLPISGKIAWTSEQKKLGKSFIGDKKLFKSYKRFGFIVPIKERGLVDGLTIKGGDGKPFEWQSDKWDTGKPYATSDSTPTLATLQSDPNEKITLGYLDSVSAKLRRTHTNTRDVVTVGTSQGSDHIYITKLDHESDGKVSTVFQVDTKHTGKNIYKKDILYLSFHGDHVTDRPPSKLAETQAGFSIGQRIGDPIFENLKIEYGDDNKEPISITTPFPSKRSSDDKTLHSGTNIYKNENIYLPASGQIEWSADEKKYSSKNLDLITTYPYIPTIERGLVGGLTIKGESGKKSFWGGDLYSSGEPYTKFIGSLKEQEPKSLLKLTRLQIDSKTKDPTVVIKTAHPHSSARFQTAGNSTLEEPIKLQNFPLLNKQGSGWSIGLEGQALGFVEERHGLFGNLFGVTTRKGSGRFFDRYTGKVNLSDLSGGNKGQLLKVQEKLAQNIDDDNIVIDRPLFYRHKNIPDFSPIQTDKITIKSGPDGEDGPNKYYAIEKVTKNLGEELAIKATAVAEGSGNLIDTYSTLAYGKLSTMKTDEAGEDDQEIHNQLNYEKTLRSASEINKSFSGGRGEIIESESSRFGVSGGENVGRRDRAKQWKADAQGHPGKPDPVGLVWKIVNDDELRGLVKKSGDNYVTALTDKINMLRYGEDYDVHGEDFIKFKFRDLINNKWIIFRATLGSISEEFSPEWSSERYIGRPDQVHVYQGVNRSLSFEFMVVPHTRQELPILWEKLNYLVGLTYPTWKNIGDFGKRMESPFINLTIGDMYNEVPGFLSSLSVAVDDNATWEIEEGFQLPKAINVSCEFTHIGRHTLASQGKHYDLGWLKKYDNTTSWTSGDSHLGDRGDMVQENMKALLNVA